MGFGRLHAVMRKTRLLAILATGERNCGGDPGRDWPYCIMNVRMLECLNVRMLECWNGALEGLEGLGGLGGLEGLEFRVWSLEFYPLYH